MITYFQYQRVQINQRVATIDIRIHIGITIGLSVIFQFVLTLTLVMIWILTLLTLIRCKLCLSVWAIVDPFSVRHIVVDDLERLYTSVCSSNNNLIWVGKPLFASESCSYSLTGIHLKVNGDPF